ncbi:hypothetical protein COCOBI_02-8330 [Coccomyxa sp. Obi]|nr:hypothetical protein COCOBI_02-8330 [Coccomyxa sp. Obi]
MDSRGELRPSLIGSYLLKRAAGFTRVCFQSWIAYEEGQENWNTMHYFFRVTLPQLAAVFAKFHVQLEIIVHQGGHVFFRDPIPPEEPQDEETEGQLFTEAYWEMLSPVLTKLILKIGGEDVYIQNMEWLSSMQKLQYLELHGVDFMSEPPSVIHFPQELSLSALKVLRLERLLYMPRCHLDCPSLEALHLRELDFLRMPTGLGSCSRLTTLDVAAAMNPAHVSEDAGLLAAIESVQGTLEFLDISGWASYPGLNEVVDSISRLPRLHALVAQRNGLTAVPALPASLMSLDLRANDFTEVPVQLESLTQLTSLALSSKGSLANFQIRRPLDAIISLPQLQKLTLVLDISVYKPAYAIWSAQSLYYLGLAQYEIARSKSSLSLKF